MLTKDRLNARVRDQRLILEPMTFGVQGATSLAEDMLRLVRQCAGETYANLVQGWLGVGEGMRLLPFFRDAIASSLTFAPTAADQAAKRERFVAAAQRLRDQNPYPSYEDFRTMMFREFAMPFENIAASLYADLEDFRIVQGTSLVTASDVFAAYHARQLELMIDHASKVLFAPVAKGRRFSGEQERPPKDGKKLLEELAQASGAWTLAITLKFAGKERTCLFSSTEFPLKITSSLPGKTAEAWDRPTDCDT